MFWAHVPLNAPEAAAAELRYACTVLGAKGLVAGGANFGGLEFDSPELDVVWKTLCDLDLPMFIHGYNQSVTWGKNANDDRYETTAIVGMQYDESRCFWNLICGGVLDRFPDLKVYITHGGGYVPYQLGRLAKTNENLDVKYNKKPLLEYMKTSTSTLSCMKYRCARRWSISSVQTMCCTAATSAVAMPCVTT